MMPGLETKHDTMISELSVYLCARNPEREEHLSGSLVKSSGRYLSRLSMLCRLQIGYRVSRTRTRVDIIIYRYLKSNSNALFRGSILLFAMLRIPLILRHSILLGYHRHHRPDLAFQEQVDELEP